MADIARKNITRVMMLSGLGHRARNRNDFAIRLHCLIPVHGKIFKLFISQFTLAILL